MTDEGSALVKVASDMTGYHHCLCAFHINQLDVRVSSFVNTKSMLSSFNYQHTFLIYVCHRINELSHLIVIIYPPYILLNKKYVVIIACSGELIFFIMTTYICVCEMYVVINCLV